MILADFAAEYSCCVETLELLCGAHTVLLCGAHTVVEQTQWLCGRAGGRANSNPTGLTQDCYPALRGINRLREAAIGSKLFKARVPNLRSSEGYLWVSPVSYTHLTLPTN